LPAARNVISGKDHGGGLVSNPYRDAVQRITGDSWADDLARASIRAAEAKFSPDYAPAIPVYLDLTMARRPAPPSPSRPPAGPPPRPKLAAEIREALAAADRGETEDLGSFAQYADLEDAAAELDRWLPPCGPCGVCGVPGMDARHRIIDAITGHAAAGETAEDVADELGLPPETVLAVLRCGHPCRTRT
jgi:hypothetical protein